MKMQATVEYAGIRLSIRRALIRDAARREELYQAVSNPGEDQIDFYAWRFADTVCRLESLEQRQVSENGDVTYQTLWQPTDDTQTMYQQWLNLPLEVLDAANRALVELNSPADPDLMISDDASPKN